VSGRFLETFSGYEGNFWPKKLRQQEAVAMPSPRKPLKRDLLKGELAAKLRVDVSEILERAEAAAFLGYKHKKSMSNRKALLPCFYMGDLGRNGLALYVKSGPC
jgi:hypothetical protein